jgi:hypothetical protein
MAANTAADGHWQRLAAVAEVQICVCCSKAGLKSALRLGSGHTACFLLAVTSHLLSTRLLFCPRMIELPVVGQCEFCCSAHAWL